MRLSRYWMKAMYGSGEIVAVVRGPFGGGKTRTTMSTLTDLVRRTKVIYAAPLRALRNWVCREYGGTVIRSKDEVCDLIKSIDAEDLLDYVRKVAETCSSCDEERCPFREEVKTLIESRSGLFCMTHKMLILLTLAYRFTPYEEKLFGDSIVVIDEAEQIFDVFNRVARVEDVERMKTSPSELDRMIARRIVRSSVRVGAYYYLRPILPRARLLVLISATLPDELVSLLPIPSNYVVFRFSIAAPIKDVVRYRTKPLYWSNWTEWRDEIVKRIVEYYDQGKRVGVASRNYTLTRYLVGELSAMGIRLYSDVVSERPPSYDVEGNYVIVWTTRGKWYRGVNLPDCDVIIATYQRPSDVGGVPMPIIVNMDDDVPFWQLMNDAVNVQSYYRANRIRTKSHVIEILDVRGYQAMKNVLPESFLRRLRIEVLN